MGMKITNLPIIPIHYFYVLVLNMVLLSYYMNWNTATACDWKMFMQPFMLNSD
jgi:hypothetical protein